MNRVAVSCCLMLLAVASCGSAAVAASADMWDTLKELEAKEPHLTKDELKSIVARSVFDEEQFDEHGFLSLRVSEGIRVPLTEMSKRYGVPSHVDKIARPHPPTMCTVYRYPQAWGEIEFWAWFTDAVNLVTLKSGSVLAAEKIKRSTPAHEWAQISKLTMAGKVGDYFVDSNCDLSSAEIEKRFGKPDKIEKIKQWAAWGDELRLSYRRAPNTLIFHFYFDPAHLDKVEIVKYVAPKKISPRPHQRFRGDAAKVFRRDGQ